MADLKINGNTTIAKSTTINGNITTGGKVTIKGGPIDYDSTTDTFIFNSDIDTGDNNPIVQQLNELKTQFQALQTRVDNVYPIGSIYMSVNATSPETLFGGTWEQLNDKFLLGAGSTYSAGSTGGNATHTHQAGSLYSKMSAHTNGSVEFDYLSVSSYNTRYRVLATSAGEHSSSQNDGVVVGGATASQSNMPPYLVVYMWKRIS